MDLYGLAPWVGSGTFSTPYAANIMFLSWSWRAKLIALGITCWDPMTGVMSTDDQHLADMARVLNSQRIIMSTGSCAFVTCDAPDYYRDMLADPRGTDLPFATDSVEAFVAIARERDAALFSRLTTDFPTIDWTDPIAGAISVIDTARTGNAEAKRAWTYYATIIDPTQPTPDGPGELYVENVSPWRVNLARVADMLALPDDTANRVWRCELAYRFIVYREAVRAFDEAGL